MRLRIRATLLAVLCALSVTAQLVEPIHWQAEAQQLNDSTAVVRLIATIEKGWHLYDLQLDEGGPRPTEIVLQELPIQEILTSKEPQREWDDNFEMELAYYSEEVSFAMTTDLPKEGRLIRGEVSYMACNDQMCLPPTTYEFTVTLSDETDKAAAIGSERSLWWLFVMGLLGGLLAIFTPCVWPIIPMTVSFFMKRSASGKAVKEAVLYGLSIIVIYVGLGLLVTLIFGASALNDLATNAVVNIFFFLLLVLFALSFFGAFELTLPASWSTRLDSKARQSSGIVSILLMAFTLVIVSFSCTGPIIGTLLVEAAGKSLLAPAVGMLGFAIALALPFSLFALFPDWMRRMPRSGSWMSSFKVVLAFLELALSLKFFSVADLAYGWHLLDREVFVSLWIVLFALLGLYLLGVFHFRHEEKAEGISVFRFMLAVCSLAFSVYMIPGLWGAPLKAISAFAPPMTTQDFVMSAHSSAGQATVEAQVAVRNDAIEQAIAQARRENKRVMLDFSGYGCVNCRKMEARVFTDPKVEKELQNYLILTLIVDDKARLDEPIEITENGKQKTLKTVGDYWSYVQRSVYGANAQPYYVKLDADGNRVGQAYSYDEDIEKFINWLQE